MNTKETIYKRLQGLTKTQFDDTTSIFEIGIDSLDLVELVTDAEDQLGVEISDETLESFKTVGDVVKGFEKATK